VRLILADGEQAGIVPIAKALVEAESAHLDLVEVSPHTDPPVCKIVDYGKLVYSHKKKTKKQVKTKVETKGIRLSLRIGQHDFDLKAKQAVKFLKKGNRVKVSLIFKGREITHSKLGYDKVNEFIKELSEISEVDQHPKKTGYTINAILKPLK